MRSTILMLIVVGALGLTASAAIAASPHFKKGGEPACTISSTSAPSATTSCGASLAGLGNEESA